MPARPFRSLAGLAALALAGAALPARSHLLKDGPPPAHTGGFGEPTCRHCHSDADLNEPGGTLALEGVPARYEPGRDYELVVTLRRAGMLRAGFQLAARFADGTAAGTQAGDLVPVDGRTAVVADSVTHVRYIEHRLAGTVVDSGMGRWVFRWTAPRDARGAVVFHAAGNAANDDDSPLGDFIYTTSVHAPLDR